MAPLLVSHSGGLTGRVFLMDGDPLPSPSSRPMIASCACCSRVLGSGICSGASAGCCSPWIVNRAASFWFTYRRRQRPSGPPCPLRGISLLLLILLLRLLSAPLGAFLCALLRDSTACTVLPPCSVLFPALWRVLYRLSPPSHCHCRRQCCLWCLLRLPLHAMRRYPYVPVSPSCPPSSTSAVTQAPDSARSASRAPPPSPAANISGKDEDVSKRTGRGGAHQSTAGGSAPRGKFPNRPLDLVGDGIRRPLFLHCPQQ